MPNVPDDWKKIANAKRRPWSGFWAWGDKPIGEHGAVQEILGTAGFKVEKLISRAPGKDPPDCEAIVDGIMSGIEVTELVHQKTLARSLKALRERKAGGKPQQPEAYFIWDRKEALSAIQALLEKKDKANLKGGPYKRYMLVIHTDETFLDRGSMKQFLVGAEFRTTLITDAILGLSYDPAVKCCPIFRLPLNRKAESA